MIELIENDDRNAAQWRLDRFVRQFGPEYRSLVQVAAVPIVLTPELVGYLRGAVLAGSILGGGGGFAAVGAMSIGGL